MDMETNQEQRDLEREYLEFLDDEVSIFFRVPITTLFSLHLCF